MNLFRLIHSAGWRISSYGRLLLWNLLFCFVYTSCSMHGKNGITGDAVISKCDKPKLSLSNTTKNFFKKQIKSRLANVPKRVEYVFMNDFAKLSSKLDTYCRLNVNDSIELIKKVQASILKKSLMLCNSHAKDKTGSNVLHLIEKFSLNRDGSLYESKNNFIRKVASQLIDRDPSLVNQENHEGETPLHLATLDGDLEWFNFLLPFTDLYQKDSYQPVLLSFALKVYEQTSDSETKRSINKMIYSLYQRYSSHLSSIKNDLERAIKQTILEVNHVKMKSMFLGQTYWYATYLLPTLETYCKLDLELDSKAKDTIESIIKDSLHNDLAENSFTEKNPENIDYVLKRIVSLLNNNNFPERKKQFLADVYNMISHKYVKHNESKLI
ncbi:MULTISPECIES: ankyrin repeat domain-containing protein [Candidatus Cardinium]|uniref:ankyrin repeat domain-containing protein n=1 Tax=Candidatus Cardinium TaxID=273135 RepID=UPI001FA94EE2|nr:MULTISPECIES: ankyrin repeat domain-containing protein [Cardinium]